MGAYILRRVVAGIAILAVSSFVLYLFVSLGGDPLARLRANPHTPPSTIRAETLLLHLNQPLLQRYWTWLTNLVVHGTFGLNINGQPIGPELIHRLLVTLTLVIPAIILAAILAILLGVMSAIKQYSVLDHVSTALAYLFFSTPVFVIGILLKDFFAVDFNKAMGQTVLYTIGQNTPGTTGTMNVLRDGIAHLVLPVLTLVLITYAGWSRYQRASMLDVRDADYVRLARAKGLSPRRVLFVHALRNALIPVTTVIALDFAGVIAGTVITEIVFGWTGMGRFLLDALEGPVSPDVNTVQAWLMITATAVIVFNLIADLLYAVLDPRIRYA